MTEIKNGDALIEQPQSETDQLKAETGSRIADVMSGAPRKPQTPWKEKTTLADKVLAAKEELARHQEANRSGHRNEEYADQNDSEEFRILIEADQILSLKAQPAQLAGVLQILEKEGDTDAKQSEVQAILEQTPNGARLAAHMARNMAELRTEDSITAIKRILAEG